MVAEMFAGQGEPPTDIHERALFSRAAFERTYPAPEPTAVEVDLAGVPCRVFRPEGEARAIFVHFHGGGMVLGSPLMNDGGNRALADRHQVVVVSVDYRLAPEHPYPAGPDDGVAVVEWLLENGVAEFGTDRLVLGGESAGGYMAAAVLLRLRDVPGALDKVLGSNVVFGVLDWGRSPSQRGIRVIDGPDMLTPEGIEHFCDCYLPGLSDDERRAPEISPAFADLRDLPPAFVQRGHRRPPPRRLPVLRRPLRGGRQRGRAVRRPRHAPWLPGLPVRDHHGVGRRRSTPGSPPVSADRHGGSPAGGDDRPEFVGIGSDRTRPSRRITHGSLAHPRRRHHRRHRPRTRGGVRRLLELL